MYSFCFPNPISSYPIFAGSPKNKRTLITKQNHHIKNMATEFDRATEVKQFDETKAGVKGLLDSGITKIPRIFIHPQETLSDLKPNQQQQHNLLIPTIDLSDVNSPDLRPFIVEKIREASSTFGFFQIINHGVPLRVLDDMISSIKGFHEQPTEMKAPIYSRKVVTGVSYLSNIDLFHAKAASWRDTIQIRLAPEMAEAEFIPEICREEVMEWGLEIERLGYELQGLLCEGLGLKTQRLKDLSCGEGRTMVGHYYPYCPEPDLTVGIKSHTDPGVLTVLLQDHIGGLQIRHGGGWVDVKPVPGALVINIGDLLQIISNDVYKSVEHRVLANPKSEARISVAVFYNPSIRNNLYGPFPELITPKTPAVYRQFTYEDYITRFFNKELDGKSLPNYYKLV